MTKKANASKKSKVTTNQRVKNVGHIVFSKKGLAVCDQVLDKAEKSPQWEKKLHPIFSWGAAVIIQSVGVLKPCGQTPPFYGSD